MVRKIVLSTAVLFGFLATAQVKIGDNVTSVGASSLLELESTNSALVVTRVANTAVIITPVNGMIVYDLSANCLKVYQNDAWSDCLNTSTATPSVTVVCTGFLGSYCTSALSGTTYVVKITNNDFAAKSVTPLTTDLVLSGMTGVTVASVSPSVATTINAGANLTITYTLSGTPSTVGTLTGSFAKQTLSCESTVAVVASKAVTAASSTPMCINTALTAITHTTSGAATGIGTATGLPAGITASWASNTITISGTPTASGTFNYSIPVNGCGTTVNATGTITVSVKRTVAAASSTPTVCNNTALTTITHATTVATSIGTATGLPAGVTASWASNTITISGTPTESGTFTYSIPLTGGGCGTVNATGTITVTEARTVTAASSTPIVCINTALTTITHTTTAATSIGTATGLPAGVTASWASNTITISGSPTASGTFTYSIPLTGGGCGTVNATGTITVSPEPGNYTLAATDITRSGSAVTGFTANWTALAGATGYTLEYSTSASDPWTSFASNPYTGTSASVTGLNALFYYFRVTSIGGTCAGSQTSQMLGCGAYVASGVFKAFMCHNLGATTSLDPNVPVQAIHGNYYQWGRSTVVATASTSSAAISGWNTTYAANGSWLDDSKTANDPCPSGFRVPTKTQWDGLVNPSLNTVSRTGTWLNSVSNFGTAIHYGPSTGNKTLTLPAAGYRRNTDGTLIARGFLGYYWSTEYGSSAWTLFFDRSSASMSSYGIRPSGFSVRCVSE